MNKLNNLVALLACLYAASTLGEVDKIYLNKLNTCQISKRIENNYEPEKFHLTNNLLRSTGGEAIYCGEKVLIRGIVVDENCVPLSDAKVYLWQVGCDGKYPYLPLKTRIDANLLNLNNGSSFQGSGIATTNNKGEFIFITILPLATAGEPSHVNVRVEHIYLGSLQTKLYFTSSLQEDEINPEVMEPLIEVLKNTTLYNFQIVMPGETLTRY